MKILIGLQNLKFRVIFSMSTYVPIQNQFRISHTNDFIPLGGHFKRLFDTIKQDQSPTVDEFTREACHDLLRIFLHYQVKNER